MLCVHQPNDCVHRVCCAGVGFRFEDVKVLMYNEVR
jgi:hypothetical protein